MHANSVLRIILGLAIISLFGNVGAAPSTMNYQARLTDSGGSPVTSQLTITFTFWDAETGGNALGDGFSDDDIVTPDGSGVLSTQIGDNPDLPIPASLFEQEDVWLNVNVNGEDLLPRKALSAAGWSLSSATVQGGEVGRMYFTASEDITPGDIVLLTPTGEIRRAGFAGSDTQTTFTTDSINGNVAVKLSPGRVLQFYNQKFTVVEITGTTIQYGPTVPVPTPVNDYSLERVADDRVLFIHPDEGNNRGAASIITISGNAITFGDITPFSAGGIPLSVNATHVRDDLALVSFKRGTSGYACPVTISGDSLTIGSEQVFATEFSTEGTAIEGTRLDADKALLVFNVTQPDYELRAKAISVTSSSLAFGADLTLRPSYIPSAMFLFAEHLGTDSGLVTYSYSTTGAESRVLTASGLTLSSGSVAQINNAGSMLLGGMTLLAPDKFFVTKGPNALFGTISGNSISYGDPTVFTESLAPYTISMTGVSPTMAFLTYGQITGGGIAKLINDGPILSDLSPRIGVAESAAAAGERCLVTIPGGITERFSNLTPGVTYYASESGPSSTGTHVIGHALTPTKMMVWR